MPVVHITVPNVRGPIGIVYGTHVHIHPSVFIQNNVNINDTPVTKIVIGANSAIGANVQIIGVGHPTDMIERQKSMQLAKSFGRDVIIGKHVGVGTGSIILPGTVLGDYSIVKAGSVVNGKVIPAHYTTDGKKCDQHLIYLSYNFFLYLNYFFLGNIVIY